MSSKHEQEVKIQEFDNIENIEEEEFFEERTKVIIVEEYNQGGMAILLLNRT